MFGHWTMTHNAKTGCKIWLDGRPIFLVITGLDDSRISDSDPIPLWRKIAEEVVRRMNQDDENSINIERTPRGDRGFLSYGKSVICTYGTEIEVYESSSAEGPHVWLKLQQDNSVFHNNPVGESAAHLNEEQARAVIARLQAWIDDIANRWKLED